MDPVAGIQQLQAQDNQAIQLAQIQQQAQGLAPQQTIQQKIPQEPSQYQTQGEINAGQTTGQGQTQQVGVVQPVMIRFNEGNYDSFAAVPDLVVKKIEQLTKTFVPMVEVALIELTGSSTQYVRSKADVKPTITATEDGSVQMRVAFSFVYTIAGYVGVDFEYSDLQADSQYIFDRIAPIGFHITKCEIDTSTGEVTIAGDY